MGENELVEILFAKDTKEAYAKFKELELICDASDELYVYFDQFLEATHSEKSCVRGRGFKMILQNARWDTDYKIDENLDEILAVLDDEKPTVVRQCMTVLPYIGVYKKDLIPDVKKKLVGLNYLKYKETMHGLIKKDIEGVMRSFL